ncbi:MAG: hypothetical protein ABFS30_08925, partial [Pseudomonadota bacterium]
MVCAYFFFLPAQGLQGFFAPHLPLAAPHGLQELLAPHLALVAPHFLPAQGLQPASCTGVSAFATAAGRATVVAARAATLMAATVFFFNIN